uniref:Uncharacterized protein n=1 Tax=Syphacia muris TaxID=451379 RepID=A0A0N5AYM3_9BILA
MYSSSSSSSGRRSLMRPYSSHNGPSFRNLPLFLFLAGLVLFVYVFYIYQAQNAELTLAKEQSDYKDGEVRKLNDQITDLKAQLEKLKSDSENALESALKEKVDAENRLKNCSSVQSEIEFKVAQLGKEKKDYTEKLQTVKTQLEQLNDTLSAMRTANKNNEDTIVRLNGVISELRSQLHKPQVDVNTGIVASSNANRTVNINEGLIQQRIDDVRERIGLSENSNFKSKGRLSKDVGPAPAISKDAEILDDKQSETDKQAVVEKSKHDDTVAGNVGHVLDDINDVKIFKKDYPNSAENNEFRDQGHQLKELKVKEAVFPAENSRRNF